MTTRRPASIIAVAGLALAAAASGALAHNERPCTSPPRPGSLPAGWTATPSSSPTTYGYNDPAGTLGGIVQIVLRATPSFTTGFRALVDVRGRDLGGATDALAGTAVLRVGNDCWSDTTPCAAHGAGVLCRGRSQP